MAGTYLEDRLIECANALADDIRYYLAYREERAMAQEATDTYYYLVTLGDYGPDVNRARYQAMDAIAARYPYQTPGRMRDIYSDNQAREEERLEARMLREHNLAVFDSGGMTNGTE